MSIALACDNKVGIHAYENKLVHDRLNARKPMPTLF